MFTIWALAKDLSYHRLKNPPKEQKTVIPIFTPLCFGGS